MGSISAGDWTKALAYITKREPVVRIRPWCLGFWESKASYILMAKGRASPTRIGSESPVKTSELPEPVRASEIALMASLLIEQEAKISKHKRLTRRPNLWALLILLFIDDMNVIFIYFYNKLDFEYCQTCITAS
jgi:hypothetical protein